AGADAAEAEGEVVRERGREGGRREEGDVGLAEAEAPLARRVDGDADGVVGVVVVPVRFDDDPTQPDGPAPDAAGEVYDGREVHLRVEGVVELSREGEGAGGLLPLRGRL